MGWKGESRRHSLSRKGIRTNIDKDKRLSVRNFVARGHKLPEVDISYNDWSMKINPDGSMNLSMGNLTTAGWYWTGDETDLGTFLIRMMGSEEQDTFIKDMEEEGVTFEMLLPVLLENIDNVDGNGMYVLTGDNARWKFGDGYDIDTDSELDYYSENYELSKQDMEDIKNEYWIHGQWDNIKIDKFEKTELYQDIKKKLIHELKTSADFEDFGANLKNLKEDVFHDLIEFDSEVGYEQFGMAFSRWLDKKKKEGRIVKKVSASSIKGAE
ncbi:hypothetical protein KAU43_07765 [candidate division WOR-3 bacterium]|nr:hypothetical protein [candidate division WOR-3 bacterium]